MKCYCVGSWTRKLRASWTSFSKHSIRYSTNSAASSPTGSFFCRTVLHEWKLYYKKLSYRRGTARCVVSVEILPFATQQCRNYFYGKSWTKYQMSLIDPCCRQSLTICAINYSGRASKLGGIIDLVDRRRPSLSWYALSVHPFRAKLITRFDDRYAAAKFSKSGV